MEPIVIPFVSNNLGRVDFTADVMKSDYKSFGSVLFKLDSGSDFTTIDCADLDELGYTQDFLESRPFHPSSVSTASSDIRLQYITNVSVKFGNREINYDDRIMRLAQARRKPQLSEGETRLHIYSIEDRINP